jgi:hypothetical protein
MCVRFAAGVDAYLVMTNMVSTIAQNHAQRLLDATGQAL